MPSQRQQLSLIISILHLNLHFHKANNLGSSEYEQNIKSDVMHSSKSIVVCWYNIARNA